MIVAFVILLVLIVVIVTLVILLVLIVVVVTLVILLVLIVVVVTLVILLVIVVVVLFHSHSGFDDFPNLHQTFLRADLPVLDLVDDVTDVFKKLQFFGMRLAKFYGINDTCHLDDGRFVTGGVFEELVQPGLLQPEAHGQHHVGVCDCGHVFRSRLI